MLRADSFIMSALDSQRCIVKKAYSSVYGQTRLLLLVIIWHVSPELARTLKACKGGHPDGYWAGVTLCSPHQPFVTVNHHLTCGCCNQQVVPVT